MPPAGFSPSLRSSCVEEEPAPLFLEAPPIVRSMMKSHFCDIYVEYEDHKSYLLHSIILNPGGPEEAKPKSQKDKTHTAGLKLKSHRGDRYNKLPQIKINTLKTIIVTET